jgi:hypothetical protein
MDAPVDVIFQDESGVMRGAEEPKRLSEEW